MKRNIRFLSAGLVCAAILFLGSAAGALSLSLMPASQTVSQGSMPSVDVVASGLGDGAAPSLGTYDLNITYDAGVLSFNSLLFEGSLGLSTASGDGSVAGLVNIFELSLEDEAYLNSTQPGSFILATIKFNADALGLSNLGITLIEAGDAAGERLTATLLGGSIEVVPEPSSLALGAMALLGLAIYGRRRD